MGNCFTACTRSKDGDSLPGQENNTNGKQRAKRDESDITAKASRKNSPSSTLKDNLSITSVEPSSDIGDVGTKTDCFSEGNQSTEDLTVIGHALPILEKQEGPVIEPGVSNTRTIVVEPAATSENSSKETSLGEGIKRPITGNESNSTSSLSSFGTEEPKCNDDLEVVYLDEETSATVPPPRESETPENPERRSYFQLLEFLKIRLHMAANNMEINRLLTNVDRALGRTSRTRELGFQRMRAAEESRRAAQDIQEEDDTHGEDTENDDGEESDEGGETPPPPIPRVCWQ